MHRPLPRNCTTDALGTVRMKRYPETDSAHLVVSVTGCPGWRRPRGCPYNSWLKQVNRSCNEGLRMGRGLAWKRGVLIQRNPWVWRLRVDEASRPSGICPYWLIGSRTQSHFISLDWLDREVAFLHMLGRNCRSLTCVLRLNFMAIDVQGSLNWNTSWIGACCEDVSILPVLSC